MRCELHDLLPGQCPCTSRQHEPNYALNRTIVQREFAGVDEPQVSATIVAVPTTDELTKRVGFPIPRIDYGHWEVLVDDRATRGLRAQREAARVKRERAMLVAALTAPRAHALAATITIR